MADRKIPRAAGIAFGLLAPAFSLLAPHAAAQAFLNRADHAQVLLPDGDIMVIGGVEMNGMTYMGYGAAGVKGAGVQRFRENTGEWVNLDLMSVHRASHTATLLPDGRILVVGGYSLGANGCGGPCTTYEIYDPILDGFAAPAVAIPGGARFNHTATLTKNGNVLICGGYSAPGTLAPALCQKFQPGYGAGDSWDGTPPTLLTQRANHTANMLFNGEIFITGGYNIGVTPPFLILSERYNETSDSFRPARPLNEGRAFHSATAMGSGHILIVGGANLRNTEANYGYLQTVEEYDPVSDQMQVAPPLPDRKLRHSANLMPDGKVLLYGGLGNIPTTYFQPDFVFLPGSLIDGPTLPRVSPAGNVGPDTLGGVTSSARFTQGPMTVNLNMFLGTPVTGIIQQGEVIIASPSVTWPGGWAYFHSVDTETYDSGYTGLRIDLAGTSVGCDENSRCGLINRDVALTGIRGTYGFATLEASVDDDMSGVGCISWTGGGIIQGANPAPIDTLGGACAGAGATFAANITAAGLNPRLIWGGAGQISSGTMVITGGTILYSKAADINFTVAIEHMRTVIPQNTPIVSDGNPDGATGQITFAPAWNLFEGDVIVDTDLPEFSPIFSPGNMTLSVESAKIMYVAEKVDLAELPLRVGISTVIIRSMVFGDIEEFDPTERRWEFGDTGGPTYGQVGTLVPKGAVRLLGGATCDPGGACAGLQSRGATTTVPVFPQWTLTSSTLSKERGNHTTTLLPNGKLLVAGGTDGPSVHSSCELFDPDTEGFSAAGEMAYARDLHTASLLPNGRVLVAGGFVTNAVSTGSSQTAEIYWPESNTWSETGVMVSSRDSHTAVTLPDGNILVFGGYNRGSYLDSAEIYYSTIGVWRALPLPAAFGTIPGNCNGEAPARARHTATLLKNGTILFAGGVNSSQGVLDSAFVLNLFNPTFPGGLGFHCVDPMPMAVQAHTANLLPDGTVVVSYGSAGAGQAVPAASFLYNPEPAATGGVWSWGRFGEVGSSVFSHTGTLLPGGLILLAGGAQGASQASAQVMLFDAAASTFTATLGLTDPRAWHTTTITKRQKVVAIGGFGGLGTPRYLKSAEYVGISGGFPDAISQYYPPSIRVGSITAILPEITQPGNTLTVRDMNLTRITQGGAGATNSSEHWHPRMIMQALDSSGGTSSQGNSGFTVDLTTRIYNSIAGSCGANGYCNVLTNSPNIFGTEALNSSITVRIPESSMSYSTAIPNGWYLLRLAANAQFSDGIPIRVGPALPNPPTAATGTVISTTSIYWTWGDLNLANPGMANGYNIFYATSGVFIGTRATTAPALDSVDLLQTGLTPNVTACILVSAFSQTGDGPLTSAATTFTLSTVPVSVGFSTVQVDAITISWNANGNSDATVYEVSYSTDDPSSNGRQPFTTSFATPTAIGGVPPVTTNYYQVAGLQENVTYYFRIRAKNLSNLFSNFSEISSATTRANVYNLQGGPCASPDETTCIVWSWNVVDVAVRYRIYNATVPAGADGRILGETVGSGSNSFPDMPLSTNTPRVVQVSAFTNSGEGPLTASVTVYTYAAIPVLVNPPMTTNSTGAISAQWATNGNPLGTEYRIQYTTVTDSSEIPWLSSQTVQTGAGGTMSREMQNLFTSELYVASVAAINGSGVFSAWLNLGSTMTWANAPTNLRITGTAPDSVTLEWDANGNTSSTSYQVTYSTDDNQQVPPGNGFAPFTVTIATATNCEFRDWLSNVTCTVSGLDTGKKYWFRVQAQNAFGVVNAVFSQNVSTTTTTGSASAAAGQLGGTLKSIADTSLSGTIGSDTDNSKRTVWIYSPAGAFSTPVQVVVSTYNTSGRANPCGGINVGVDITPTPYIQPVKPLSVTVSYSSGPPSDFGTADLDTLVFMRYDPATDKCVPLPTSIDTVNLTITALINHLSFFQVGQALPATSPETTKIFPNPFFKGRDGFVTFTDMPAGSRVRIHTLRGDLVYDRVANDSGILQWYGLNTWGRTVASGVYLATIQFGDDKKIMKLVVLR